MMRFLHVSAYCPRYRSILNKKGLVEVPTFVMAGHETTATAATWVLFTIAQDMRVQRKLRDELLSFPSENPSMGDLHSLPYLDMVVKEALRHHAPVPVALRAATKDDVIPLSSPYVDRSGVIRNDIQCVSFFASVPR